MRVDADRLWADLMDTATIGATAGGGITRLTLTHLDRQARDWLRSRCQELGAEMRIDTMGVMFARFPGQRDDLAPIAIGSHLDTQPSGGRFDGVLGVLAALEVMRTLRGQGHVGFAPLELINWTNEEGARFEPPMISSGVFAGALDYDWAMARTDRDGVRFGDALAAIGYCGQVPCGAHPLSGYFELHIEQGPVLETEGRDIGIVTGVQGMRWYEVTVRGQAAHAGTTPMHLRRNALLPAARLVQRVDALARGSGPIGTGTVGSLQVRPNSPNVIPGEVSFTVDLRHPEKPALDAMERELTAAAAEVGRDTSCEIVLERIWDQPPIRFATECVAAVRDAAREAGLSSREMISGAGHDAAYVARVAPASMIFVPSHNGLSHSEAEFTSKEQCAAGAQVLLHAVLNYDRFLAGRQRAAP